MSENVIEARDLTKRYNGTAVVNGISFAVARGEIFGLLGPNGAGKTTTILMLLGLSDISSGQARVLGYDPAREPLAVKRRVGYLPDQVGFYDNLTAAENLRYAARLMGIERGEREDKITASLRHVGLADVTDKRVGTFSRGMRQRLGLAEILIKEAQIAILDEPTSGLDPQATVELLNIIRELKHQGVSVLLSSHLLERVQSVCDRVALFNQGNIALIGTVPDLGRQVLGGGFRVEVEAEGQGLAERIAAIPGVQRVEAAGANRVLLFADRDVRPEAAAAVVAAGGRLLRLSVEEPSSKRSTPATSRPMQESVMRREGSALHGFGVVTLKEVADHFTSILVVVLVVLVVATAVAVVRGAVDQIKEITAEDPYLFLRLFTRGGPLPLVALLSFLVPLIAIGLGFDAVNGEHNRRTLSRILSQPIYRDALLFGKFVAGLFTLSISLIVLWLLVIGFGLVGLGVPPNAEEMARALVLLVVTIAYGGFWFALALLFSIVFRSAATAALGLAGGMAVPHHPLAAVLAGAGGRGDHGR